MAGTMVPCEGVRADLDTLSRAGFAGVELSALTGMSTEWLRMVRRGDIRRCCDYAATEVHDLAEQVRGGGTRDGIVTRYLLDGGRDLKWAPIALPQALIEQWHRAGLRYVAIAAWTGVPDKTIRDCHHGKIGCMSVANFRRIVGSAHAIADHLGGCIG